MMSAREIRAYRSLSTKLIKIQERGRMIGNLIARGVGFREEEEFMWHESGKYKCQQLKSKKKKEIVNVLMMEKKKDNLKHEQKTRRLRNLTLGAIEGALGRNSRPCRDLRRQVRTVCKKLRVKVRRKNDKKANFLCEMYGRKEDILMELEHDDRVKYGGAKIFESGYDDEEVSKYEFEPCIVCYEDEVITLNEEEKDLLALGPKFSVRNFTCVLGNDGLLRFCDKILGYYLLFFH